MQNNMQRAANLRGLLGTAAPRLRKRCHAQTPFHLATASWKTSKHHAGPLLRYGETPPQGYHGAHAASAEVCATWSTGGQVLRTGQEGAERPRQPPHGGEKKCVAVCMVSLSFTVSRGPRTRAAPAVILVRLGHETGLPSLLAVQVARACTTRAAAHPALCGAPT